MAIGAVIGGALIQGSAAKKAAKAQERAANQDIAFQRETRDLIRNDLAPYRTGGYTAQQALDFELGLGARPMIGGTAPTIETFTEGGAAGSGGLGGLASLFPNYREGNNYVVSRPGGPFGATSGGQSQQGTTRYRVNGQVFNTLEEAQAYANANRTGGTEYGGFTKTPGYDFRLNQGTSAIEAGAAARGGLFSGAAMRYLLQYGQDYASSEYNNFLNRLAGRADTGMNAATMSGQASQVAAGNVSNALGNIGNARSAGAIGVGNAITGGIQNALGVWNYQNNLGGSGGGTYTNAGTTNPAFFNNFAAQRV